MRAAGDQAKTTCGNIQMCEGLKAGIEGSTHAVGKQRLARVRARREATEEEEAAEAEEEKEGGGIAEGFNNLNIETGITLEEAAERMAEALGM